MERIRPVLSAPCGESVRLLVCLGLSRLLCYCMKSWTCNHPRKAVVPAACWLFPIMSWARPSSETSEHLSQTLLRTKQRLLFLSIRVSESQPCTWRTIGASVDVLCAQAPPVLGPLYSFSFLTSLLMLSIVPVHEENYFSFYPLRFSPRDSVKLEWKKD